MENYNEHELSSSILILSMLKALIHAATETNMSTFWLKLLSFQLYHIMHILSSMAVIVSQIE
jgi:hypothetical protein